MPQEGDLPEAEGAIWHPSPNFGPRRGGAVPDMVVLHYTAMESAGEALERLCSPPHEVSSHYLIGADGTLWQLVAEEARAWHAGQGSWGGAADVNSRSIGIELDNRGKGSFAVAQLEALERLLAEILARWSIPPERVIGHQDMAPGRKQDPGRYFPWPRLARKGLQTARIDKRSFNGTSRTIPEQLELFDALSLPKPA
ncbi:N-acetylmuramoyl-L-alanine amidase [Mangrovicoccus ximenensis]|uniref:N-acetylmuramoyl-L-alanine amidase n=1 Tax=Mangrovicoccus ximenensis TaxID=1911570 RepID=UPI001EFF9970|nr:N-acetylmuramoyl-L-alanine amidase [Mangrovicoccus ximenensis]